MQLVKVRGCIWKLHGERARRAGCWATLGMHEEEVNSCPGAATCKFLGGSPPPPPFLRGPSCA